MGFMDKLMFWKKDSGLPELPTDFNPTDTSIPGVNDPFGQPRYGQNTQSGLGLDRIEPFQEPRPFMTPQLQPSFAQPAYPQQSYPNQDTLIIGKNIEILSSKMDALQASLESINQRLMNIERIAMREQQPSYSRRW